MVVAGWMCQASREKRDYKMVGVVWLVRVDVEDGAASVMEYAEARVFRFEFLSD